MPGVVAARKKIRNSLKLAKASVDSTDVACHNSSRSHELAHIMNTINPTDPGKSSLQSITDNKRVKDLREKAAQDTSLRLTPEELPRTEPDLKLSEAVSAAIKSASAEYDSAKVDTIKEMLRLGNYPLDPRKIAESIVELEKLL
jgi:anti-sigma28 factor (negative regulator of flagellin synthesis)